MTASTLEALAERCEKATGPDRELDAEIALAIKGGRIEWVMDGIAQERYPIRVYPSHSPITDELQAAIPSYTRSIDAALTLKPEELVVRGTFCSDGTFQVTSAWFCSDDEALDGLEIVVGRYNTICAQPAAAISAVSLRARAFALRAQAADARGKA